MFIEKEVNVAKVILRKGDEIMELPKQKTITVVETIKPEFNITSLNIGLHSWDKLQQKIHSYDFYFSVGIFNKNKLINEILVEYGLIDYDTHEYELNIWVGLDQNEKKIFSTETILYTDNPYKYLYVILEHLHFNEEEQEELVKIWNCVLQQVHNSMALME